MPVVSVVHSHLAMQVSRIVELRTRRDQPPGDTLLHIYLNISTYTLSSVSLSSVLQCYRVQAMLYSFNSLALLAFAGNVAGWGGLGHRTVGYLAEHYFTEDAAQLVKDLIKPSDSFDISDAAIWADGIRQRQHWTEGWHFIGEYLLSHVKVWPHI